jgi:UDP:flavonoid glycosyltransferase YjiC (YdhE family)
MAARVICVVPGFTKPQLTPFRGKHIQYSLVPISLQSLLDADLCITYGAEGTMMRFLMAGVPQLISPWHVEALLIARRIEDSGLGVTVGVRPARHSIDEIIRRVLAKGPVRHAFHTFKWRAANCEAAIPADAVVSALRRLSERGSRPVQQGMAVLREPHPCRIDAMV